jgi:hypothetical protein
MTITNLLANMVVLTVGGDIPTNTPSFQAAVLHTMVTNAQAFAPTFGIDPARITSNSVTYSSLTPRPLGGFRGTVVFDRRYAFRAANGRLDGYADKPNYSSGLQLLKSVELEGVLEKWRAATNQLTTAKAKEMAIQTVESAGLFAGSYGFIRDPRIVREPDEERTLPFYLFEWQSARGSCRVEVSGIISNVVSVEASGPFLQLERPANYLDLLGLPRDTVFVKKKFAAPGQPQTYELYDPNWPPPLAKP